MTFPSCSTIHMAIGPVNNLNPHKQISYILSVSFEDEEKGIKHSSYKNKSHWTIPVGWFCITIGNSQRVKKLRCS
ncbi:hypothetical protein LBYZC6_44150 [Lacrimispora brassicae]